MDFGKGARMEFSNGKGREREFDAGIPGNCGEREFPLTPDSVIHMASIVFHDAKNIHFLKEYHLVITMTKTKIYKI